MKHDSSGTFVPLKNPDFDLLESLEDYFNHRKAKRYKDDDNQHRLGVSEFHSWQRYHAGRILHGDYGRKSRIEHKDTAAAIHDRKLHEAELEPFFFEAWVPATKTAGIVIVEQKGKDGIMTSFRNDLTNWLYSNCSEAHKLHMQPLMDGHLLNEFIDKGTLHKITFSKRVPLDDIADFDEEVEEEEVDIEVSLKARPRHGLPLGPAIKQYVLGHPGLLESVLTKISPQMEFDDITLEVKRNAVQRKFYLEKPDVQPKLVLTDLVKFHEGQPDMDQTKAEATKWIKELSERLGNLE